MPSTSLKIGLVLDTSLDSTDGVPQYVTSLGKWLSAQGHEVHYIVGQSQRSDLPNLHSLARNFKVTFNGNKTTIPLYARRKNIKKLMASHKFDVLHVQTPHHPLLAQPIIMAAPSTTAVVATFHILPYGKLAVGGSKALGIWLQPSIKRIDSMMAVSQAAADFCKRSFGRDAEVVPNMVDYNNFNSAKPLVKYQDNKLTVLFLGRLVERKGCQYLLEAIAKLDTVNLPDFRVLICGRGSLESSLKKYVQEHGLRDKVEFTGFVDEQNKPRYYASADIAVFPSQSGESFGIVLIEAMSSGKSAILAGDNPGYRSVMSVRPELLFDPQDVDGLTEKLANYLTDAGKRLEAAKWGSMYAKNFDVNVVGSKILTVYKEALLKRRQQ